jgi:HD-GYP domain-containing protein (c-di-GMP phosphodiesterase class II)
VSSSRPRSIIEITPFLPRPPRTISRDALAEAGGDFIELVDDPPAPPDAARLRASGLTVTWRLFLSLLGLSVAIGAVITPLILLIDPFLSREHLLLVGLLIYSASILTATGAYWLVRGLTARWLRRLSLEAEGVRTTNAPEESASNRTDRPGVQATEIDRLFETVTGLIDELKYQLDTQKRTERNDLIRTITALARALEARDPYTQNHSRSVARLSVQLGKRLGLSREALYEIHLAGILHDIGKIGVPDQVLMKPGRLTEEEMALVRAHVEWSYTILSPITMLGQVGLIVRHHHERFDGEGYPDRLAGEAIPLGARVMAVADMFVAMIEDRPYRKGLPVPTAIAELRRVSGSQVDPSLVACFLAGLEEDGWLQDEGVSNRAAAN